MSNSFTTNPIILDTFTSAIDVNSSMGFAAGTQLKINFIEWQVPTTAGHTAVITNDSGTDVFRETAITNNQSIKKDFYGGWVNNLNIGISGVGSGKISIMLD